MNLTLWIAAGLLAVVALAGGISKTFIPRRGWPRSTAANGRRTRVQLSSRHSGASNSWPRPV